MIVWPRSYTTFSNLINNIYWYQTWHLQVHYFELLGYKTIFLKIFFRVFFLKDITFSAPIMTITMCTQGDTRWIIPLNNSIDNLLRVCC